MIANVLLIILTLVGIYVIIFKKTEEKVDE